MRASSIRPPRRGFTLIEVMVALVVMAIVAALGWQGVDAIVRTREVAGEATTRVRTLAAAVAQWEQDLQGVFDTPRAPGLTFDGASLRIVRRVPEGAPEPGVQVVVWSLRGGALTRWAGAAQTQADGLQRSWLASQQLTGREPGHVVVLRDASAWTVQFARRGHWTNAQSSGDVATELPPTTGGGTVQEEGGKGAERAPTTETGGNPGARKPDGASPLATVELPQAVRLVLTLPEGPLNRDVVVAPQL